MYLFKMLSQNASDNDSFASATLNGQGAQISDVLRLVFIGLLYRVIFVQKHQR